MQEIQLDLLQEFLLDTEESNYFLFLPCISGALVRVAYQQDLDSLATCPDSVDTVFDTFTEMCAWLEKVISCIRQDESLDGCLISDSVQVKIMSEFLYDLERIDIGLLYLNELLRDLYVLSQKRYNQQRYFLSRTRVGLGNVILLMNFLIGKLNEQRKTSADH